MAIGITIIDVCRQEKVEPVPALTWAVGARVAALYERRYGRLPSKDLRTKTSGTGSHCFAVYPLRMRDEIAKIIREYLTKRSNLSDE